MDSQLMAYRLMSQMVRLFLLPEIEQRVKLGRISPSQLPFEVRSFRVLWKPLGTDDKPDVELDGEIAVITKVKAAKAVAAGQAVCLDDIHPSTCTLSPPTLDGHRVAYFLCVSTFLDYHNFFDFGPNHPGGADEPAFTPPFPIAELAMARNVIEKHPPKSILEELQRLGWPPSPAYYPALIPDIISPHTDTLGQKIAALYNPEYWDSRLKFWDEIQLFPNRITYIQKAIEEFFEPDYISAIHVITPQFEGILRDYLSACKRSAPRKFEAVLREFKRLLDSRKVFLFPQFALDQVLMYLKQGTFWNDTSTIADPTQEINRHGIAHGVFKGFENKQIALKWLILLDALGFVLLHDRIVTGTL